MNCVVLAPDDDTLSELAAVLKKALPSNYVIEAFLDPLMVIKYGAQNRIDMAFITSKLSRKSMSGISFGEILRKKYPNVELVFCTDDDVQYSNTKSMQKCRRISGPLTEEALKGVFGSISADADG